MADSQTNEIVPDVEIIEKPTSKYDNRIKIYLYIAMGLSAWGDRMWNFAIGIYFISLNPKNLQGVAINGITLNLAVIFFGTTIGVWIDRSPRLSALRKSLFFQNISVALMAVLVVTALYNQSTFPPYWMIIIQGFLICIGIIATLASVASKVSISRDWIVALYGSDKTNLTNMNATLRRIDLVTNILAPILTGAVMAYTSRWISAVIIASWNIVSLGFELLLYTKVYRLAESVLANKVSVKTLDEKTTGKKEGIMKKYFSSAQGLGTYTSLSVCFPGISLALLYMTVLSFDSVTRAYVTEQRFSEVVLGIFNGIGAVAGILGTIVYPIFVKRLGLVRTGVIGFWSEFSVLILCLLSLFAHGTSFIPLEKITLISCHTYEAMNNSSLINTGLNQCSNSKLSVYLLLIGITFARFGLWMADLTVTQLQQERVPDGIRGKIGGTQQSLNQCFDMLRYIFITILPGIPEFGYHICLSMLSVFIASFMYTCWSCSSASQLVPPAVDIEMNETNIDLAQHYENRLGQKLDYVDEEITHM